MNFEFATATEIIFGAGSLKKIKANAQQLGKKCFVLLGSSRERAKPLLTILETCDVAMVQFQITEEPTIEIMMAALAAAQKADCDSVIGFGGGSVVDTGKAVAALLRNPGDPMDYLEVIGKGLPIQNQPAFYVAIPTTSGTGAEVTRNAVLSSTEHKVKVSMRHQKMLPDIALIDPELTLSMPKSVTAATGLDALTQLIEAYISPFSNPLVDGICEEGIKHAAKSLQKAWENGDNLKAREGMCIASLFSGIALANAKLGAVHGIAGPLGGMLKAPHGIVCGKLLPFVISANVHAITSNHGDLDRFQKVAAILTSNPLATIEDGIDWINQICNTFNLPPLREFGLTANLIPSIVSKSFNSSSMKGNPVKLSEAELQSILEQAI